MKGQSSAELLLLFAALLFVLAIAAYLSNQQLTSVSQTKEINKAVVMADDLASAADEVYYQGYGARKRLVIDVPQNVDTSQTYISSNSIVITTSNTTIVADSQVPVHGILPLTPGKHEIWVVSEGSSVRIGYAFISISKGSLFFTIDESDSDSDTFEIENVYDQDINVTLYADWLHSSDVALSVSPNNFSLNPDDSQVITVSVQSFHGSAGIYDGDIVINATDGVSEDSVSVPVTVYVLAPPVSNQSNLSAFYVTPDEWSAVMQRGQTIQKYFYVCTNGVSVQNVEFTTSGTAGSWVWNTGDVGPIARGACVSKLFYITVPTTQPTGNYTGTITATADGGTYTDDINLKIEVIDPVDTQGPQARNVVVGTNTPNPSWVIHAYQDDVIVNATCDDRFRGNSNILYGEATLASSSCNWVQMDAVDGAYDSPLEDVTYNMGVFAQGTYHVSIRCADIYYNIGNIADRWFSIYPPDHTPPSVSSIWLSPSNNPGMSDYITVHAGADDWNRGDSIISNCYVEVDSNGTHIPMTADDGAYDQPYEDVSGGIGTLDPGVHTVVVFCNDYYNNTGNGSRTFTVHDDIGPLSLNLYITTIPSGSRYRVYAHATGNDTGRGNSDIDRCRARINNGGWRTMYADDGSYDSPVEDVNRYMGQYNSGTYTLSVRCRDSAGNWGPTNSTTVSVPA